MNRTRPYLNKFVLQKQLEITDSHHLQNMKKMKPITSRLMQHAQTIIINYGKAKKIKEVREIEIQRENQSLLGRMSSVLGKEGSYSPAKMKNYRTKVNKSLNQIFRKKQEENIALQNERYQARLINKKPTLNLEKIDRDWKHNKRVMNKMSNCHFYLTTFRPKETKETPNRTILGNSIEIKNKLQIVKLQNVMVIDGHKLQIKIEYSDKALKIIGKLVDSQKVSQIIQIPKTEAMSFLNQNCGGKIENILAKLRYNQKNGFLYIISNYQEQNNQAQNEINPENNQKIEQQMQKQVKSSIQSKDIKDSLPSEVEQVVPALTVRQNTIKDEQRDQQKITQKLQQTNLIVNKIEKSSSKQQLNQLLIAPSQKQQQKQIHNQPQQKNQQIAQHEKQPEEKVIPQQANNDGQTNPVQNQVIPNNNVQIETPGA